VALLIVTVALVLSRAGSAAQPTLASPVSIAFDKLQTFNGAGRPQSAFHAGSVVFVRPFWTLSNVSGNADVTITCSLTLPGHAGAEPCGTAAHRPFPNGRHATTLYFGVPRVASPFRLVVGIAVGSQVQRRAVTIRIGGPTPPPLAVWPIAGCSATAVVGVRTTCEIAEFVTNDGVHTLGFPASPQVVVTHLARTMRIVSDAPDLGAMVGQGASVVWSRFQLMPQHVERAIVHVSFIPTATDVGRHVVLITRVEASALDLTTRVQVRARSGALATPGWVTGRP
jgi:hypothetical protein